MLLFHIQFLIWAWNALGFGAAALLLFRARTRGENVWGGSLTGVLALLVATLFAIHSTTILRSTGYTGPFGRLMNPFDIPDAIQDALKYAIPALVAHLFYREERVNLRQSGLWRAALGAMYLVCAVQIAVRALRFIDPWRRDFREYGSFISTAVLCASSVIVCLLVWQTRHNVGSAKRKFYQLWAPLFSFLAVLQLLHIAFFAPWLGIVQDLIAVSLLVILAYYVQPLTLDVLIKEVTFYFFVLIIIYAGWWILPPAWFWHHRREFPFALAGVWLIASAVPWLHRTWVRWLDRVLLGRVLTANEARACFLSGLEGAIMQNDLVESGERALNSIFGSPARICLNNSAGAQDSVGMRAPILVGKEVCGFMEVAARTRRMQFLSEDAALLTSLAGQFAILLDNLRLREKRLDQERREKDLQILATRAELRALRAQINPHFLFNSLSAIAGLISTDSAHARETVEHLAEVFRYTLSRSQKEWVRLEEELEFVTTYLAIERARFGARLQVEVCVDEAARKVWVPSMALQILVENAIKHGVSSIRGVGMVKIRGECRDERLLLEVLDSGSSCDPKVHPANGNGSGFGLKNIQERLLLSYGSAAALRLRRVGQMTSALIEMPVQKALLVAGDPRL